MGNAGPRAVSREVWRMAPVGRSDGGGQSYPSGEPDPTFASDGAWPMISPRNVHETRAVVGWVLRLVGYGLVLYGVYLVGARLAFALIGNRDFDSALQVWDGIGEDHGVFRGLPMVAVGLVMALTARWVARWAIGVPEKGCPGCGYAGAERGTCPECGLDGLESDPDTERDER